MIVFTANDKQYECPNEMSDVTFAKYCEYMNLCKSAPELLVQLSKAENELIEAEDLEDPALEGKIQEYETLKARISTGKGKKEFTEWKMRVVELFTGLDVATMSGRKGINIESLDLLFNTIENALLIKNVEKEIINSLELDGETYYIADNANMTLGEFLEAAQIEEMNNRLGKGQYESMIDIAAILLRKEGEEYSDEIYERNKAKFSTLSMDKVVNIAFFFQKKNEASLRTALLSLAKAQVANLKAQHQSVSDGTLSLQA